MTNRYHLAIETPEGNLAQGMRQLNGVYTQWMNRAHKRVGHVFQGRYKAILVEKDSYLLELARYVVLNPVRAGMVSDLVRAGVGLPSVWDKLQGQIYLGGEKFIEQMQSDQLMDEIPRTQRRPLAKPSRRHSAYITPR